MKLSAARAHRYERLDAIASGGMGTVYLARMVTRAGAETVAIKVLHPHLAHNADVVAMFLDEARIATRMRHPNLVGVVDMDMVAEDLVIVMEYVEGCTLGTMQSALRKRSAPIPLGVALRIVGDALAGLHAMHELLDDAGKPLGLVHRDVSPHNLLVGSDGVTKVADFGVALAAGRLASTGRDGTVKGKLQYLAPEQVGRKTLDRRVDVFAAGIVLWECLTGDRLFEAPTEAETVTRVLRDPIEPPSARRPDVPLELDEVCLRALERDPDRRFPTAAEFAEALHGAAAQAAPAEVGVLVCDLAAESIRKQRESLDRAAATPRRSRRAALWWTAAALTAATSVVVATRTTLQVRSARHDVAPASASAATAQAPADPPRASASSPVESPPPAAPPSAPEASHRATQPEPVFRDAGVRSRPRPPPKPRRPFMPDDL